MMDRLAGLTVTFKDDIREDDAHAIIDAIRLIRGVQSVDGVVADIKFHIAQTRLRSEISKKLHKFL